MGIVDGEKERLSNEIADSDRKIEKYEAAYDSLNRFKSTVGDTKGNFEQANKKSRMILSDLDRIRSATPPANDYLEGMSYTLSGIGMKVVNVAFSGLQNLIDIKKAEYKVLIEKEEIEKELQETELAALKAVTLEFDS